MINKYYDEELRFLREDGREFARKYPNAAGNLFQKGGDPDVERLLEGVAFLCGRIRRQIDDGVPEISQALLNLVHPHLLRPLPRASMLRFRPISGRVTTAKTIPTNTEVRAVLDRGTVYPFRTCGSVRLYPFVLSGVSEATVRGSHQLRLQFETLPGAKFDTGAIGDLPVYIRGADWADGLATYQWLCQHVVGLELLTGSPATSIDLPLPTPEKFSTLEELFRYPSTSFFGYRLLQEFFVFRQRFTTIRFPGFVLPSQGGRFELLVRLNAPRESDVRLAVDHFAPYCVPVLNVFDVQSKPVHFDQTRLEYLIQPDSPGEVEIVSVNGATGRRQGTSQEISYQPLFSFDLDSGSEEGRYYYVRRRDAPLDGAADEERGSMSMPSAKVTASFVDVNRQPVSTLPTDVVVFKVTCSNGSGDEGSLVGRITQPSDESPEFARFTNIGPVSAPVPVPWTERMYWKLISQASMNQASLQDAKVFRSLLRTYNWEHLRSQEMGVHGERCIEAIERIECRSDELIVTEALWPDEPPGIRFGTPIHGRAVTITCQEQNLSAGELFLFGSVLNVFLASSCSLNAFSRLIIKTQPTDRQYTWPPQLGQRPLL